MKLNCFRKTLSAILCAVLIVATVFSTGAFSFAEEFESRNVDAKNLIQNMKTGASLYSI